MQQIKQKLPAYFENYTIVIVIERSEANVVSPVSVASLQNTPF
jgi:hypothetical protein